MCDMSMVSVKLTDMECSHFTTSYDDNWETEKLILLRNTFIQKHSLIFVRIIYV